MSVRHSPPLLLAAIVLLAGCPREHGPEPADDPVANDQTAAPQHRPGIPAEDLIRANAQRPPGQDALPVLRRLDEPREMERELEPNRHQPAEMDTVYVYHYDGLVLDFIRTHNGREIIENIEITDERYDTPQRIRVGMSREEVRSILGEPQETAAGEDRYFLQISEPGPEELFAVEFVDDRVRLIRYGFYVD